MKKTYVLLFLALTWASGAADALRAQATPDVGIDERLGSQVALDAVLKDEHGADVTLRQLVDKPTILTLNYFRCTGICTPLLNGVADVLNEIGIQPGKDFQVITVSFDPGDTPEVAHQKQINYLRLMKRPVPPAAWRFLTGAAQSTKQVADSVGFEYRAVGAQFVHPGAVILLTPEGLVSRYMYGITFLPAEVQLAVQEAAAGQVRPSISRILAFCYSYDPQGRQYVLNVTRIMGTVILVLAGAFVVYLLKGRLRRGEPKTRVS